MEELVNQRTDGGKILSEYSKEYIKITTKWNVTKARDS